MRLEAAWLAARDKSSPAYLRLHEALGARDGNVRVVVLQPPRESGWLMCGEYPMTAQRWACGSAPQEDDGLNVRGGHRYADPVSGLVVICCRGGNSPLTFNGRQLRPVMQERAELAQRRLTPA